MISVIIYTCLEVALKCGSVHGQTEAIFSFYLLFAYTMLAVAVGFI